MKRNIIFVIVVFCAILAALYGYGDKKTGQWERRTHVWKMVSSKAMRSPFIGHGLGSYDKTLFLEFNGKSGDDFFQVNIKPENKIHLFEKIIETCTKNGQDWKRLNNVHFQEPGAPFSNLKGIMDEMRGKNKNPISGYVWNQPHNEFLRVFYEFGALGVFLMCGFVFEIFRKTNWNEKESRFLACSFIAFLILACVHFPFYLPCVSGTMLVLLGVLEGRSCDS